MDSSNQFSPFIKDEYESDSTLKQLLNEISVAPYLYGQDVQNSSVNDYFLSLDGPQKFLIDELITSQNPKLLYVRAFNFYSSIVGLYNLGAEKYLIDNSQEIYSFLHDSISENGEYSIFCPLHCELSHMIINYSCLLVCATMFYATQQKRFIDLCSSNNFILSMKRFLKDCYIEENKSFRAWPQGEYDTRSTYCAVVIGYILGLLDQEYFKDTHKYIGHCISYDGGITGVPGNEPHCAYTYCGLSALYILKKEKEVFNTKDKVIRLLMWLNNRQMPYEGGFNGRPNKLVDTCYSYWCAGSIALASDMLNSYENTQRQQTFCESLSQVPQLQEDAPLKLYFNRVELLKYITKVSTTQLGGLRDKPNAPPDAYHTFYGFGGYLIAKGWFDYDVKSDSASGTDLEEKAKANKGKSSPFFNTPAYSVLLYRERIRKIKEDQN